MGWFKRTKSEPAVDAVGQYTQMIVAEIEEARELLAKISEFEPKNSKHQALVKLLLSIAGQIPETRMADARSCGWAESKLRPFLVTTWGDETNRGQSYATKIYYNDLLVIDWVSEAGRKEEYHVVRFGAWCEELFEMILWMRHEVEEFTRSSIEQEKQRAAEHEATRFKPIDHGKR